MNYINNKDIKILWSIYKGVSMNREKFDRANVLKVFVRNSKNLIPVEYTIDEEGVITISLSKNMLVPDIYSLYAVWIKNDHEGIVPEGHGAFRCISKSEKCNLFGVTEYADEDEVDSAVVTIVVKSNVMSYGYDGLSAYEMAVLKGKTSLSEEEWIEAQSGASATYETLQSQIDELAMVVMKPALKCEPNAVFVGVQTNVRVVGTAEMNLTSIKLYAGTGEGKTIIGTGSGKEYSATNSVTITSHQTKAYSGEFKYNSATVEVNTNIEAVHPIYYGLGTSSDAIHVSTKKYNKAVTTPKGNTFTASTGSSNGQYFYLLVPKYMASAKLLVGGYEMQVEVTEETFNEYDGNVAYNVYKSKGIYDAGTTLQVKVE